MKKNIKKNILLIRWIILSLIIAAITTTISVLSIEYRIFPKSRITGEYASFDSYKEMLFFASFIFFSTLIIALIIPQELKYEKEANSDGFCICPTCEEVHTVGQNKQDVTCPKCGVKLVPLKGFYDKKDK